MLVAHSLPPLPLTHTLSPTVLAVSPNCFLPSSDQISVPMLSSEILIASPNASYPEALIYTSNRNDPREGGDTIEIFSILPAGSSASLPPSPLQLQHLATTFTSLNHLRAMILFGPDSCYLIAGGTNSGGIKVFQRLKGGRLLKEVAWLEADGNESNLYPTAFLCL